MKRFLSRLRRWVGLKDTPSIPPPPPTVEETLRIYTVGDYAALYEDWDSPEDEIWDELEVTGE